jgi:conjugative relaxase-like TrwC/TraI family protein
VLTSCKLTGSAADVAAYHASEENYYFSQGGEGLLPFEGQGKAPGHVFVHGKLSHRLGFAEGQAVTAAQLEYLLSGKDAHGQEVGRAYKVMGIDLTFSAPKSVSIAALLTDRNPNIMAAHDAAVLETMAEIERHASGTRLYIDKQIKPVKTGNLAYVTVRDGFNRDHEPHLHTHVVVMNMTETSRKVMTLDGRQIMRQDFNKLWGSMYRAKLACRLKEAGYSVSYTKKGEVRLDSVSLELEREFSKRRAQIAAAKGAGERDFDAWRKTRKGKDHEVNKAEVLADWQERLARHADKTVDQNRQAALRERDAWFAEAKWSVEARQERAGERGESEVARWQAAAGRATETCAAVTPQALVTEYLTELARGEGWAPMSYAEAERRLAEQVRLGRIVATDDGRYTTWEMARVDRQCLERQPRKAGLELDVELARSLVKYYSDARQCLDRRGLSPRQAEAAVGILTSREATVVVQGDAGAGKTTMLAAINHVTAQWNWEIVGLAVQGVAARKLEQESGIKSQTLASYLGSELPVRSYQPGSSERKPRLIIVDEASMLGSRDLAKLSKLADLHGDKVVLVGDQNQLQAIGAGRPFDRLVEAAEKSGNLLCLSENFRQRDPELRKAVDLARGGRMRESIDQLNRMGCVTEFDDARLRRLLVAAEYSQNTLLITGSRESRKEINALVRDDLVKRGLINQSTSDVHSLSRLDADGAKKEAKLELAVGDVVAFQKNEYREYDVRNGDRGRITCKRGSLLTIDLESGRTLKLDLDKYSDLDYGYAMTTYKSQGLTFDKVVIDADTSLAVLQDQRNTYVQITRARLGVRIFTDDRTALRHQAGILNFKQDTMALKTTLAEAIAKERSVRGEVLAERARLKELARDAVASKTQEAALAARAAADGLARNVEAAKAREKELGEGDKAGKGEFKVYSAELIQEAAEIKFRLAAEAAKAHEAAALAARELAKARTAEKDAGRAEAAAYRTHLAAASTVRSADERVRKARFWEKAAARAAQEKALQYLTATSQWVEEARVREREEGGRLTTAERQSRQAQKLAAQSARLSNFQGTPETVVKAAKSVLEVELAARELEAARAAEKAAERGSDDARNRCNSVDWAWREARDRVWRAGELVRTAYPLGKAKARAAQEEAQRAQDALTQRRSEVKLEWDQALAREQAAGGLVKAAQARLAAAQERAAQAARINALEATQEALRAKADLAPAEQKRVSEYLSRGANANILRDCDNPQQAVAVGLIASRTRSADEATRGMEKSAADKVADVVDRQRQVERDMDRSRSRGRDRGFGLSL